MHFFPSRTFYLARNEIHMWKKYTGSDQWGSFSNEKPVCKRDAKILREVIFSFWWSSEPRTFSGICSWQGQIVKLNWNIGKKHTRLKNFPCWRKILQKKRFGGVDWNLNSKTRNPKPQNPESNIHKKCRIKNENSKIQHQTSNIQLHGLSWTTSTRDTKKVSHPCYHISSSSPGHQENPDRQPSCWAKIGLKKKHFFLGTVLPLPPSSSLFLFTLKRKWKSWTAANQVVQLLRWFFSNLKPSHQKLRWRKNSQAKHVDIYPEREWNWLVFLFAFKKFQEPSVSMLRLNQNVGSPAHALQTKENPIKLIHVNTYSRNV